MIRLLKFYKYAFAWENHLLLGRAIRAARLARRHLKSQALSPELATSIKAVEPLYLPPQQGWTISDAEKVARFSHLLVNLPTPWGRCVQQALIAYHLLNGYGFPARLFFGIRRDDSIKEGHAWVALLSQPDKPIGEASNPRERFAVVYSSPKP